MIKIAISAEAFEAVRERGGLGVMPTIDLPDDELAAVAAAPH